MIKVPGTPEGIAATEQLISEGINVNVTLLFALEIYEQVAAAYRRGLERLGQHGGDLSRVASVASFFISRIDEAVDQAVEAQQKVTTTSSMKELLSLLYGKVAISSAKKTYQTYLKIVHSDGWLALARQGARPQRLLWASTGVKNPQYRDVLYAEELIGKDTINTLPLATMDAFRDHGIAKDSLTSQLSEADRILNICTQVGIPLSTITDKLLVDGLRKFEEAFAGLLQKVALLGNDAAPAAVSDPTKLSYSDFQRR
jgi:transaldolase